MYLLDKKYNNSLLLELLLEKRRSNLLLEASSHKECILVHKSKEGSDLKMQ